MRSQKWDEEWQTNSHSFGYSDISSKVSNNNTHLYAWQSSEKHMWCQNGTCDIYNDYIKKRQR